MKIKSLFFAILTLLLFSSATLAQHSTVTPNYVTVKPASCNSNFKAQQLYIVQNDGIYQCVNNVLVRQIGGGSGNSSNRNVEAQAFNNTLTMAIKTIGKALTTLNINTPQKCSTALVFTENITLEFTSAGKIVAGKGCSLTVSGKIEAKRIHIFEGFTRNNLTILGSLDEIFPEWFGAVGDRLNADGTLNNAPVDNFASFQLMLDVVRTPVSTIMTTSESGRILIDAKNYWFSDTLQIFHGCTIEGVSLRGSVLDFAPNKSGLRFNGRLTEDTVKPYERNSDSSVLRNLTLRGAAGADTHTVGVSTAANVITLTRTTGAVFFAGADGTNTGISSGYTVNINGMDWFIKSRVSDDEVTLFPHRLRVYRIAANQVYFVLPYLTQAQLNTLLNGKIVFSGASSTDMSQRTITAINLEGGIHKITFSGADLPVGYSGDAEITALPTVANQLVRFNQWSGIDARIKINVENVYVTGFPGHGVRADSQAFPSTQYDSQPNLNNARFVKVFADSNHGAGFFARGVNSNQITVEQLDTGNNAASIYDASFLGNSYKGIHSNSDRQGAWIGISPSQGNNAYGSQVLFGYIEDGQPSVLLGANSTWYDGDVGPGFAYYYFGAPFSSFYSGNVIKTGSPDYIYKRDPKNLFGWKLGQVRAEIVPYIFAFGESSDAFANSNTGAPGSNAGLSYFLTSPQFANFNGGWRFQYAGWTGTDNTKTPFIMTNSNQSMLGAGRIIFPNGMFFGNSTGGNQSSETDVVEVNKNVEPGGGLTVSREVKLLTGDVVVSEIGKGVILKSPDGSCYRVTVQNGGGLVSTAVTCPAN